jgi:hypothetical protein
MWPQFTYGGPGWDQPQLNVSVRSMHYGASAGRLLGSGILAAGIGMSVTVEAWVFGAFLRIASAAASKSATTFSSALGGQALWFGTMSS